MEARSVIKHPSCLLNSDCQRQGSDSSCVHPFSSDNITRLIRIIHNNGPPILFVGSINEIYRTSKKKILFGILMENLIPIEMAFVFSLDMKLIICFRFYIN
jgi:hypothetical protein